MIHWTEEQIDTLAKAWVALRLEHPFANQTNLLQQAQENAFAPNERRPLTSLQYVKTLPDRIMVHWKLKVNADLPPPKIIEVPVEKEVDYRELLNRLPAPTCAAILLEKLLEQFGGLNATNGHRPAETVTAPRHTIQSLLSQAAVTQKKVLPRVAVCTPDCRLFAQLQDKVKEFDLPVDLRLVDLDSKKPALPTTANYVVFPHLSHASPVWKVAREEWPRKSIVEIGHHTGTLLDACVQSLRDLVSRQRPTVAAK